MHTCFHYLNHLFVQKKYEIAACMKNALGYTEIYQLWNFFGYLGRVFFIPSFQQITKTARWMLASYWKICSQSKPSIPTEESWNWLVKSSIPGALSPVFPDPTDRRSLVSEDVF